MGTSRCWQDNVVNGFTQSRKRKAVAERKKTRRLLVRKMVKDLKAKGKSIDLQAINKEVLNMVRRKKQGQKRDHAVLMIK